MITKSTKEVHKTPIYMYQDKFKEDILKLSVNYVKVINERDSNVANVLSAVKPA